MVDTSCKQSVWSVRIRSRSDPIITNWKTNGASYSSQLLCLQQRGRIWSCPSWARSCPNISCNQVGNQERLSTNFWTNSMGVWNKDEHMARYFTMVEDHLKKLDEWIIKWVPQKENGKANTLVRIITTLLIKDAVMLPIYLKVAHSITPKPVCNTSQADSGWMHVIVKYL